MAPTRDETGRSQSHAGDDLALRVKTEQLDMALHLTPFTVLVSLGVVQVITYLEWSSPWGSYVVCLDAMMWMLAALTIERCMWWRSAPRSLEDGARLVKQTTAVALGYGMLLGSMPVVLFQAADQPLRLLIASACAGLIATCMSAAVLPVAALLYAAPIMVGALVALVRTGDQFYNYVIVLLIFYSTFIVFTIVHLSRLLTLRVVAQADLEHQQEVTNLLLNDFEENASDWLWEVDGALRLKHASARFADVSGYREADLQDLPLNELVESEAGAIWTAIAAKQTFSNVMVAAMVGTNRRWWSLSGKPVFDRAGLFVGYRGVGSDVTEKKRSEERLSHLALHDALTDLPNRVLFHQALEFAQSRLPSGLHFAVLCIDLDGFKNVNDTFGHAVGDLLLLAVADRLRRNHHSYSRAARLAGDEFAILIEGPAGTLHAMAEHLAGALIADLNAPFALDDLRVSIGASIGIALAPQDGDQIMTRADLALYRMKGEGRNGWRFFERDMDDRQEARRALKAELRAALDRHEFVLHFQPIVGATGGMPVAFEALVRWVNPNLAVGPGEFIPVAEETGVIIALGEWILHQACRTAVAWPEAVSIAVNISPIQLRHSDLPTLVRKVLRDTGLAAQRLELEIIESVFLDATPMVRDSLEQLRAMGVRLSLDDFGTGYSSLSYLRRLPFDKVKIDQSFVRDLPHDATNVSIIRAIIELSTGLGMTITAEGVETEAQLACLARLGCQQMQGYLFGRPMPASEAAALVFGADAQTAPARPAAA